MTSTKTKSNSKFTWLDLAKAVWYFLEGQRKKYIFLFVFLGITFAYGFIPPYLLGKIVDFFTNYQSGISLNPLWWYIGIIGIGTSIFAILRLGTKYRIGNIGTNSAYSVKVKGFERLMNFSIRWHDKENTGNKINRIEKGSRAIEEIHGRIRHDAIHYFVSMFGALVAFALLAPQFVLFFVGYLIVFFIIQIAFYGKIVKIIDEHNISKEQAAGSYYEGVGNLTTIKTLGVRDSFSETINAREKISRDLKYKSRWWGTTKWQVFQVFDALATMVFLYLVIQDVFAGLVSFGSILVFYTYMDRLGESAKHSTQLFDILVEQKSAVERMMPIFQEADAVYHGEEDFPRLWDGIAIKGGSFSYKEQENVEHDFDLSDINFMVRKYEKIGIVGKSGSGKSTLAKILLGLYRLDKGNFRIGESSFYDIDNNKLTEHMTTVMQDSEMFNMSLRDNLTLMRKLDPRLLERAIRVSRLDEVIEKLPDGLNTLIGEKGYRLSGGERQRVGIARAIYKDPEILVLDEATSSLDRKTEASIQRGLEQELTKKTMIIIAHRVSTLENVDTIYVFDGGHIVEQGTFDELSGNSNSKFSEINKIQGDQ